MVFRKIEFHSNKICNVFWIALCNRRVREWRVTYPPSNSIKRTLRFPGLKAGASPSTRAQAEGLRILPERRFFTPLQKAELRAAEWVEIGCCHVPSTQRQKSLDGKKVTP